MNVEQPLMVSRQYLYQNLSPFGHLRPTEKVPLQIINQGNLEIEDLSKNTPLKGQKWPNLWYILLKNNINFILHKFKGEENLRTCLGLILNNCSTPLVVNQVTLVEMNRLIALHLLLEFNIMVGSGLLTCQIAEQKPESC